jgi:hypothetical protein
LLAAKAVQQTARRGVGRAFIWHPPGERRGWEKKSGSCWGLGSKAGIPLSGATSEGPEKPTRDGSGGRLSALRGGAFEPLRWGAAAGAAVRPDRGADAACWAGLGKPEGPASANLRVRRLRL